MSRRLASMVAFLALLGGRPIVSFAASTAEQRRLWILVPVFSTPETGPGNSVALGSGVSTLMFLQLFTTLRKWDSAGHNLGNAGITWDSESLAPLSFEEADHVAAIQNEDPITLLSG